MKYTINELKKSVITKIKDVDVLCHECFASEYTFDEILDVSFIKVKKWHNWAAKRFNTAWFMVKFIAEAKDSNAKYGVYLDFDGDGIVYDAKGNILGVTNNAKSTEEKIGVTRGNKWVFLDVNDGDEVTLYIEVKNNAPHRPLSFPAFYKNAYFGTFREDIFELYYRCVFASDDEAKRVLSCLNTLDRASIKMAIEACPSKPYKNFLLVNNLEYGHLKPMDGYSRECLHEYVKVIKTLQRYENLTYLTTSAYDVFAIRNKAIRNDLTRLIQDGRIIISANLTDIDTAVTSANTIINNLDLGKRMVKRLYGVDTNVVNIDSYTVPQDVWDILKSAGIEKVYTNELKSGTASGIEIISKKRDAKLLNEYNVLGVVLGAFDNDSEKVEYNGDIKLPHTEGAYTNMAKLKLYNRQVEQAMRNIEFIATYSYLLGNDYRTKDIEDIYKVMLKYASYQCLAGNNIKEVNDKLRAEYVNLGKDIASLRDKIIAGISDKDTKRCIINTSPYERNEWFKVGSDWYKSHAQPYSIEKIIRGEQPKETCNTYSDNSIENDVFKLTFSRYGEIISLIDKRDGSEHIGGKSLRFYMYNDAKRKNNAINIPNSYLHGTKATFKFKKHKVFIDGATIIWQNQYVFRKNSIVENIVLTEGNDYVRVDTKVVWQDVNTMLRIEVVPHEAMSSYRTESQVGSTLRNVCTDKNDIAECLMNRWLIAGDKSGLGIAVDSKNAVRVTDKYISINLLRSTRYPDRTSDIGTHYFSMALMPNANTNSINRLAYEMVSPIIVEENVKPLGSLVELDNENIIVEHIKKGNSDKSILIRLSDIGTIGGEVGIATAFEYARAYECNVLGEKITELSSNHINMKPGELKTILFEEVILK